jgi:hypothetical protein
MAERSDAAIVDAGTFPDRVSWGKRLVAGIAAGILGLSPITLSNYTRLGYSDLVRGVDYFVRYWQEGPYHRRKLFFTEQGLHRLKIRAYRVFRPGPSSPSQRAFIDRMDATVRLPRREDRSRRIPPGRHSLAANRLVREQVARVMREYLEHPCAVPTCPCMTHRLGLPTLAELVSNRYFTAHRESHDN